MSHDFSLYEKLEHEQEKLSMGGYRNKKTVSYLLFKKTSQKNFGVLWFSFHTTIYNLQKRQKSTSETLPDNTKWRTTWKPCHVTVFERQKQIHDIIISDNESTLICSYFTRHLAVFNLTERKHIHTLTDESSMLQLNKVIIFISSSCYDQYLLEVTLL